MMKQNLLHILLSLLMPAVMFTSCIRDEIEDCPPLNVRIGIEDKNYFNVDEIEKATGLELRLPEDEPFRYYIQKLFYVLYDMDRKEVVMTKHLHEVEGNAEFATAYLPADLPFGTYVLLVWGNIDSEEGIMADGRVSTYDLHRDHVEGYDVYMTCDTLKYDEWNSDYTVWLQRVKGKLIIEGVDIPEHVNWSRKAVSNLSGNVDYRFDYQTDVPEYVVTETDWSAQPASRVVTHTVLSPTLPEKESTLYVRFFDDAAMEEPVSVPENVNIQMDRNMITILRYKYVGEDEPEPAPEPEPDPDPEPDPEPEPEPEPDPDSDIPGPQPQPGHYEIYILVNDNWELMHGMEID